MTDRRTLKILAPYVATPPEVISRMLGLAGVDGGDVVYDLGCGDGRICIGAAKEFGARAVGVDIEPFWIERARADAEVAGVSGLATFHVGDACHWDVGDATVITFYLTIWSTQVVAREVLSRARVGTRVVSHAYPIHEREPERQEEVIDAKGDRHRVFMWTVGEDWAPAADDAPA